MRRSEGVAAQEAPAITRKAGLLSDQKGPSRTSNGTGKNAGLSSQMRVHFPTMEIRVQSSPSASPTPCTRDKPDIVDLRPLALPREPARATPPGSFDASAEGPNYR